jgi:hypothetical protein
MRDLADDLRDDAELNEFLLESSNSEIAETTRRLSETPSFLVFSLKIGGKTNRYSLPLSGFENGDRAILAAESFAEGLNAETLYHGSKVFMASFLPDPEGTILNAP